MAAVESFLGLQAKAFRDGGAEDDAAQPMAEDRFGNRFRTAMPARR